MGARSRRTLFRRPHGYWFDAESERLPSSLAVNLLRWWIPGALCLIGAVLLVVDDFDTFGASAFGAFAGAGSSVWLINFLWRLGVSGDDERDREARDRAFLATRGRWPSAQERAFNAERGHWPDEQVDRRPPHHDHRPAHHDRRPNP